MHIIGDYTKVDPEKRGDSMTVDEVMWISKLEIHIRDNSFA